MINRYPAELYEDSMGRLVLASLMAFRGYSY